MERVISFVQGVAMMALVAAMVTGYSAAGAAAAVVQSCDDDPYCHDMRGTHLFAVSDFCSTPTCNSRSQWCCLDFE